jgi:hypothetical protein
MPSTPGAPLLALTCPSARPRFSRESSRSHNETSRPGRTASPECADRPLRSTAVLNGTSTSPPGSRPACAGCLRLLRSARAAPTPPPHPAFGPSRLMSVPPPVLRPLLTSARSTPTSRCEPSARRHHSTNRHPGRSPRTRTINFPLRPPRLRCDPVDSDGLHLLEQAHPDRPGHRARTPSASGGSPAPGASAPTASSSPAGDTSTTPSANTSTTTTPTGRTGPSARNHPAAGPTPRPPTATPASGDATGSAAWSASIRRSREVTAFSAPTDADLRKTTPADSPGQVPGPLQRTTPPPQPPAAPARARPPRRQHLPAADQAPARPRRPPQRIRASRVEAQVKTCGRVLESHNLGTARIHRKPILNGLINEYAHAA